jgi:hypothetical protein
MQEIFVALILLFDVSTGQLIGAATAATDNLAACEAIVAHTVTRARDDLQVYVEGGCIQTLLIAAPQ